MERCSEELDNTAHIEVSIVIPAYCEAENLPRLMEEIAAAMGPTRWSWEVIIVDDDSQDGTPAVLQNLAAKYPQFHYLIRRDEKGLSSAVLAGFNRARGDILVVMDADLSHPPDAIGAMVRPLMDGSADFVAGSRYIAGGGTQDDWGMFRKLNSAVATALGRPFAGAVRDPMAGFVALRRETYLAGDELNPIGYKIGLELMVKCRVKRVLEVPIFFRNRLHGQSKLTMKEQWRYLEHLSRLYDYQYLRGSPRVKCLITSAVAAIVGYLTAIGVRDTGLARLDAVAAGLLAMLVVTGLLFGRYKRSQQKWIQSRHPWEEFFLICGIEFTGGMWVARWLSARWPFPAMLLASIGTSVVLRYMLRWIMGHDIRGVRKRMTPRKTGRD